MTRSKTSQYTLAALTDTVDQMTQHLTCNSYSCVPEDFPHGGS